MFIIKTGGKAMSKKAKKKNKTKGTVLTIILTALITTIGMYVYNTYTKIDVNPQNYETQKTLSTEKEQTVENVEQKSQTIANTLEQTMESVVGISKLKDAGRYLCNREFYFRPTSGCGQSGREELVGQCFCQSLLRGDGHGRYGRNAEG